MTRFLPCSVRVLATLAVPAVLAAQQSPSVRLDEAIRLARGVRPAVVQARTNLQNADAQVRSARGAYLPSLNASTTGTTSFSEGAATVNPNTGQLQRANTTNTSVNLGLSASLDLFTGFRRGADRRAAGATRGAAEASLTDAEYQSELAVTQQFFDALAAQQLVRVRQAGVRRAEEQLALAVAKLRVGSATRSDSLRSLVNLGNARLALVQARSDVAARQAGLGRLLGETRRVAAEDDSAFYAVLPALDTAAVLSEAEARSPRVQSTAATARAARAQLSAARSTYWPTLALSGSTRWNGNSSGNYDLSAQRQLSLGLSWALFDGFQREQGVVARLSSLDVAEANAADARRELMASLTTQLAALDAAGLRIEITGTSVAAAAEDLRVVNERYRVGAATILDVLTSQESLAQAEVDAISARFDYLRAKAQIEALIGQRL